jgi:hypothetical protein
VNAKKAQENMADRFDKRFLAGEKGAIVGFAWYRKETFDRCKELFADADSLHDTFEEWEADVKKREKMMLGQGVRVVRAYIDPDLFPVWCADRGFVRIDGKARSAFAAEAARIEGQNRFG